MAPKQKKQENNNNNNAAANNNSKKAPQQQQVAQQHVDPEAPAAAAVADEVAAAHPFFGVEVRVEMSDKRVIVGQVAAFQGSGDMILFNALEVRSYTTADGKQEDVLREGATIAVPFRHVVSMHKRTPGLPTLLEQLVSSK